jgi:hypothetical protein
MSYLGLMLSGWTDMEKIINSPNLVHMLRKKITKILLIELENET